MPRPRKHLPKRHRSLPTGVQFRSGRFRIRYALGGVYESETYPTLDLAQAALEAKRTDIARRQLGFADDSSALRLSEFANSYVESLRANGKTNFKQWQKKDAPRLARILAQFGDLKLTSLTPQMAEEYRQQQMTQGRTYDAATREISLLKTALSFALKMKVIPTNLLASVECRRMYRHKIESLSDEEIQRILENAGKYRPLIVVVINTGLRFNELLTLSWSDVDSANRVLVVRPENAKAASEESSP